MKRIIVSFLVIFFTFLGVSSCTMNDDDQENFHFENLEALSAEFPETFKYGDIYRIRVAFNRPSDCHFFEGFDFRNTGETERTIAGVATVFSGNDCENLTDTSIENFFDFEVLYTSTYTFKFWTGENNDGEDEFLIVEVPVEE